MSLAASDPTDLLGLTESLVAIPSVSGNEKAITDEVENFLSAHTSLLSCTRIGNSIVARSNRALPQRIVLAGHLDTVPPHENAEPRLDEDTLYGLGAADMKSGLAVMLLLATHVEKYGADTSFIFYDGEEVADMQNGLRKILDEQPELAQGNFALLLEPTANTLEAGCQGSLIVKVDYTGKRSHTVRPWLGDNAIHKLGAPIENVALYAHTVLIDGLEYRESMQIVSIEGGVANNVIPDNATLRVNYRFAPNRSVEEATQRLTDLFDGGDVEVLTVSPPALPTLAHPLVAQFAGSLDLAVKPKLAWTDVARFASFGIPAVNFGPGDPQYAHRPDEQVTKEAVETSARLLTYYLTNVAGSELDEIR